jgi:hypothetical protein
MLGFGRHGLSTGSVGAICLLLDWVLIGNIRMSMDTRQKNTIRDHQMPNNIACSVSDRTIRRVGAILDATVIDMRALSARIKPQP